MVFVLLTYVLLELLTALLEYLNHFEQDIVALNTTITSIRKISNFTVNWDHINKK